MKVSPVVASLRWTVAVAVVALTVYGGFAVYEELSKPYTIPVQWNECWGPDYLCGSGASSDVRTATVNVDEEDLEALRAQLKSRRRSTQPSEAFSWGDDREKYADRCVGEYGIRHEYLEGVMSFWENEYDWRAAERKVNSYNPKETNIDGLNIFFYHVKYDREKYPAGGNQFCFFMAGQAPLSNHTNFCLFLLTLARTLQTLPCLCRLTPWMLSFLRFLVTLF